MNDNLLKVIVLFLPVKKVLGLLILTEVLEEDQDGQMFEVALL